VHGSGASGEDEAQATCADRRARLTGKEEEHVDDEGVREELDESGVGGEVDGGTGCKGEEMPDYVGGEPREAEAAGGEGMADGDIEALASESSLLLEVRLVRGC